MKKLMTAGLALFATLTFGQIADACTATGVYDRATAVEDTQIYDNVRDVIETDSVIQDENWQNPDATHAAVGTVLREAWIKSGDIYSHTYRGKSVAEQVDVYDDYLSTRQQVRDLLNEPNGYTWDRHTHLTTVRDHAVMHGNDWEDGTNGAGNPGNPPGPTPPPVPPTPIDHAG